MGVFNGVFPIRAGKEEAARAFAAETYRGSSCRLRGPARAWRHHPGDVVAPGDSHGQPHGGVVRR